MRLSVHTQNNALSVLIAQPSFVQTASALF
jgi:hypothetical protein